MQAFIIFIHVGKYTVVPMDRWWNISRWQGHQQPVKPEKSWDEDPEGDPMARGDSGEFMENRYLSNGQNGNPWLFSVYIGEWKNYPGMGIISKTIIRIPMIKQPE